MALSVHDALIYLMVVTASSDEGITDEELGAIRHLVERAPVFEGFGPARLEDVANAAVDATNATLPDYARIQRWTRARENFDALSGMATANGRPQRATIWQRHADALITAK